MMKRYVLRSKWLYDGKADQLAHDAALLIEEEKIVFAGAAANLGAVEARTYNFENATILPGLIDAHVHLTFDGSSDPVQKVTADSIPMATLRAVKNTEKLIQRGITTVRDCGSRDYVSVEVARASRDGLLKAPHILASGPVICITGGHGYFMGHEADGPDEVRKAVREVIKNGADFIKLIATGGVITPGTEVGFTQFNQVELEAAVVEATKVGLRTAAHAHGAEGIRLALQAGISTVEHASYIDETGITLFLQSGAVYVSTLLASRRQVEHLTEIPNYMSEKISSHIDTETESVKKLIRAGVTVAGGTDAGTPFNPHGDLVEQLLILSECGLGNIGTLKAGTYNSALALGIHNEAGSLQPGKRADILVVKGNPVDNLQALKDVLSVWKSGKCLINNTFEERDENE
jgi:imidazolonepropionase-like amidohydrolase